MSPAAANSDRGSATAALLDRLARGPLLADGAMGTLLYGAGIGFERCFEALCETQPDLVRAQHARYIQAGARLIETNTFGANAFRLAEHGLEARVHAINLAAARIAREAADAAEVGERVWVAGSVGPLGPALAPLGPIGEAEARAAFGAQIAALAEGGVDLIVIETMRYLREAMAALAAAREVCELPVAVQITFGEDGRTVRGRGPAEVAWALDTAGADIIGANCSTGPAQMLEVMAEMAGATRRPLSAMPNAGLPAMHGGRYVYTAAPAYMAEVTREMLSIGVALIGGCCGSTPEHIEAMRDAIAAGPAVVSSPIPPLSSNASSADSGATDDSAAPADPSSAAPLRLGATPFERALARGMAIGVGVDPPRGFDAAGLIDALRPLAAAGRVDAFGISDGPRARPRASALAIGALVQASLGASTLLHFSCRHRNLVAIHADLMGAHALGLRDLVVVMGELPAHGDYPNATVINDITDLQLIQLISGFNEGYDAAGRPLDEATAFHVGCRFHFGALDLDREVEALERKAAAGARFALSDPLYDAERFEAARARAGGRFPIPILLGILPLASARHAAYLHNEVPGIDIPESLMARMREAGDANAEAAIEAGLASAQELLEHARPHVGGVHLLPPFERYEALAQLLGRIRQDRPIAV
jgi:homocysteine S-methyltransferase